MEARNEMKIVQNYFSKGHKLGKLIPKDDYHLLQKQFQIKALDKDSKNYLKFRALSLGFDTALTDRGLINKKPSKKRSGLKELIRGVSKQYEQDQDLDIDF